ncbi:MAG: hypothetical protein EAZ35_09440 [Sphingobacteriia bacterium]|nr:MAG: hypothetical protein EAZ35_09440 [Sphingobacteriia bacterium]
MKRLFTFKTCLLFLALSMLTLACKKDSTPTPLVLPVARNYTTVSTFVGSNTAEAGSIDGTGLAARFNATGGMAQDDQGNLFVADIANHTIRKVSATGVVTTFAGSAGVSGNANGIGSAARFNSPYGLTIDAQNNIYVAEYRGHTIRKITSAGVVTTVAGNGISGSTNGIGASANFNQPIGIALDNAGNLFVGEFGNSLIRKIVLSTGIVSTFASGVGNIGGICIDAQNNLYLASGTDVKKISATGTVTSVAGSATEGGVVNGQGTTARFNEAFGICRDAAGNLYVNARSSGAIRKISADGLVSDFAGLTEALLIGGTRPKLVGDEDGALTTARFRSLSQLYINTSGIIYVSEEGGNRIRTIQ